MKNRSGFFALLVFALIPWPVRADIPGTHPAFLHALMDLRDARWNLVHREGDATVSKHEQAAIEEIDRSIGELSRAATADGKNTAIRPAADARLDHPGRLHHALDLLRKAREDASDEEDNAANRELRHRAVEHIDIALHETERAIWDAEHHQ